MTLATLAKPLALPGEGEGWLILHVGLPRLLRNVDRVEKWIDRYSPDRFLEASDELRTIPGSDTLALLAAIPLEARLRTIDRVDVPVDVRPRLRELMVALGDPVGQSTPAAGLLRMYPSVVEPACEIPGDDKRAADAFLQRGISLWENYHSTDSKHWLERALGIYKALGDSHGECKSLLCLGNNYAVTADIHPAFEFYRQALNRSRSIHDRKCEGLALGNMGNLYLTLGHAQEAVDHQRLQLAIARELGDRSQEGSTLGNLGLAYMSLGQLVEAIALFQEWLSIAREMSDLRAEGNALGNIGDVCYALGRVSDAIDYYQKALAISRKTDDRRREAATLRGMGHVYRKLGQIQNAIDFYLQQRMIDRQIGDRHGEAMSCWNHGCLLAQDGRLDEAIPLMEQLVHCAQEMGHPNTQGYATLIDALSQQRMSLSQSPAPGPAKENG